MDQNIQAYNDSKELEDRKICDLIAQEICNAIPDALAKVWHGHPVWFLDGNPIVGYSKMKNCVKLLFWSGQSFDEEELIALGSFKAAGVGYTSIEQVNIDDVRRWLKKSLTIRWDYKNIAKNKGILVSQ